MRKPVSVRRQKKVVKKTEETRNEELLSNQQKFEEVKLLESQDNILGVSGNLKNIGELSLKVSSQEIPAKLDAYSGDKSTNQRQLIQLQESYNELYDAVLGLKNQNQKILESYADIHTTLKEVGSDSKNNFNSLSKLVNDLFKSNVDRNEDIIQDVQLALLDSLIKFEATTKALIIESVREFRNNFENIDRTHKVFSDNLSRINSNVLTHIPYLFKQELSEVKSILLGTKKDKDLERTISFQLGKELIDGVKNVKEIISLPQRLKNLREENLKRKKIAVAPIVNQIIHSESETGVKLESLEKKNKIEIVESNHIPRTLQFSDYDIVKKKLKNKKIKILSILSSATFEGLSRESDLNYLLEINDTQVAGTTSDLFILESVYSTFKNVWNYSTFSNNSKHPMTQKLLDSFDRIRSKQIPVVFLDRSTLSNYSDFELIRNKSDVVLACSKQVKLKNAHLKNIIEVKDFYDEFIFTPNEFSFKKTGGIAFFGEFRTNYSRLDERFKLYLNELSAIGGVIFKNSEVDNSIYDDLKNIREIDTFNSKLLAENIKKHDFIFYIADERDDFISEQLLSYLASYRPVISTRNRFLERELKDIITFVDKPADTSQAINLLKDHRWISQRKSHLGYRLVTEQYTTRKFVNNLSNMFIQNKIRDEEPLISILMATMRENYSERIVSNLVGQNYRNKEVIIMTQNWTNDNIKKLKKSLEESKQFKKVVVLSDDTEMTLGERLNLCFTHASSDSEYVAKMDDDDFYFPNYLKDMMIPFSFGNYAVVGKWEYFIYLEELDRVVLIRDGRGSNRESDLVAGATLLIKKTVFEQFEGFKSTNNGEDSDLLKRIRESQLKIYSCDPFNLVVFRSKDVSNHTFRVTAEVFEKSCTFISNGIDESIVTV
ncbi:glycosyltransferase [Acinetobacter rudis]|uniref:glycosyltransferase n=1 Tax=Acinetobacter rudis TaxID=632955 RepID=UPI00333E6A7A